MLNTRFLRSKLRTTSARLGVVDPKQATACRTSLPYLGPDSGHGSGTVPVPIMDVPLVSDGV